MQKGTISFTTMKKLEIQDSEDARKNKADLFLERDEKGTSPDTCRTALVVHEEKNQRTEGMHHANQLGYLDHWNKLEYIILDHY